MFRLLFSANLCETYCHPHYGIDRLVFSNQRKSEFNLNWFIFFLQLGSLGIIILSIMALATDNLFKGKLIYIKLSVHKYRKMRMYNYSINYIDIIYLEKNVALIVVSLVGSCFYFITSVILLTSVFKGRSNGAIPWLIMSLYVIIACVIVFKFLIVVGVYLFALPFLVQSGKLYFN